MKAEDLRDEAERRGVDTHLLGPDDDPAELARRLRRGPRALPAATARWLAVADVAIERAPPVRRRPFRDAQPLRTRSGPRPRRPVRRARGLRRRNREGSRRRTRQRPALSQQRLARHLCAACPPSRRAPSAPRRLRSPARARHPPPAAGARSAWRSTGGPSRRGSCSSRTTTTSSTSSRSASASAWTKACSTCTSRTGWLPTHLGGAAGASLRGRRPGGSACARRSTASRRSSRRRSSFEIEPARYGCFCPSAG